MQAGYVRNKMVFLCVCIVVNELYTKVLEKSLEWEMHEKRIRKTYPIHQSDIDWSANRSL